MSGRSPSYSFLNICMYVWSTLSAEYDMDQPDVVARTCCMFTHIVRVWINRVRLPVLHVVSCTGKMNISLSAFVPEIWSRETGSAVPSRVSLLISILRLNLVLTNGIPPEFCGGVHLFILNRHTPSGQSEFIRSRNCVPMAFTAESPPAQGQ